MIATTDLTPLQRDALREMLAAPTHALVRQGRIYAAAQPGAATSGPRTVRHFTYRLVRKLHRDYLADFDEPDFPTRVTLTSVGLQLARQLAAQAPAKAVRA